MPAFKGPVEDYRFLLLHWLDIQSHYQQLNMPELDGELVREILNQGARFAEDIVAPLNRQGDEQGCSLGPDGVTTPEGFAQAYRDYVNSGWHAMLGAPEFGGQGLPVSMALGFREMLNSANMSWYLTSMLTESAVLALTTHGSESLKQTYLAKLIAGEWSGTMCLTEPQAGTDLGLMQTRAAPEEDGSYRINGSKIFISAGDHDWTDNIVHMVLARLPDAPAGVKGISLFLVPKYLPGQMPSAQTNGVSVGALEKKMGLKGSPTCVMNFDDAKGFLVGEPNRGLACMFTMMNEARFQVGIEGLGIAEAAYQGAVDYASERLQSRSPLGPQQPNKPADSILCQPDVRRMLLTQKALVEGCRALVCAYAKHMDISRFGAAKAREHAEQLLAFLTPITKAFFTDVGQEASQLGIQVYGGHGYIREWGMEQLLRDSRITQIYEGTNGIQSLDLIGRKLVRDKGKMLNVVEDWLQGLVNNIQDQQHQHQATLLLQQWLDASRAQLGASPTLVATRAHDYLQYSAYMLLGMLWHSMADSAKSYAAPQLASSKAKTCAFYLKRILPRAEAHLAALQLDADDLLALEQDDWLAR